MILKATAWCFRNHGHLAGPAAGGEDSVLVERIICTSPAAHRLGAELDVAAGPSRCGSTGDDTRGSAAGPACRISHAVHRDVGLVGDDAR